MRILSICCALVLLVALIPSVGATSTGNSPNIILADDYISFNLLDGASNFTVNGTPIKAPGVVGVAGADIDYGFDLAMATYVDYIVVDYYCDFYTVPDSVSAQPFQANFKSGTPVDCGGGHYQVSIPFSGIIPSGLTIRFSFPQIVYTEINIQAVTGYVSDTVVVNQMTRVDFRSFVTTNTATPWSTLTNQKLPWGHVFQGYSDPMSGYKDTLRSGVDLNVCFDFIPVRWSSKCVFTFAFPYRFVQDPDTLQWYSSDDMFEFGVYIDKTQSAEGSYYPDVTYTKAIEYADNSVGDYAPWMVYKFSVDLHGLDMSYSKLYFASRFYGFGNVSTNTSHSVITECTISPVTYHVEPPPTSNWLSSLLGAISRGFDSVVNTLKQLFSSDSVQDSADNLYDNMQDIDDFVGNHEAVVDEYVPDMVFDVNDKIYSNANAFAFVGSMLSGLVPSFRGLEIVLTLPIVIGLLCALCQRIPGATRSIRKIAGDD